MTESEARVASEAPPLELDEETVEAAAAAMHQTWCRWKGCTHFDERELEQARAALSAGLTQGGIRLADEDDGARAALEALWRDLGYKGAHYVDRSVMEQVGRVLGKTPMELMASDFFVGPAENRDA